MANTEFSVEDPIDFNPQVGQSVLAQQCVVSSLHFTIELTRSGDIQNPSQSQSSCFTFYIVTNPSLMYDRTIVTKTDKFII